MLDSKQLLTALLTLLALAGIYVGYNAAVGPLTDFDPIDPQLLEPLADSDPDIPLEQTLSKEPEIAAVRGFGPDCKELNCDLKIEYRDPKTRKENVPGRGLGLYIYFDDHEVFKDDPRKIRAHPISLVHIAKSTDGEAADEISTVRGDEAIIEFDRPVDNITKIQSANPVAGEIRGKMVQLKNNRKSADPDDDITLFTEKLVYSEAKNLIWAPDWVRLDEKKIKAEGYGLELELHPKDPPGMPRVKRKTQAKEIRLMRGVVFHLSLDDEENFLGGGPVRGARPAAQSNKGPTPVTVRAKGSFIYNLESNKATFSKSVQVVREIGSGNGKEVKIDQLECDDLALQFEDRKDDESSKPAAGKSPPASKQTVSIPLPKGKKAANDQGKLRLIATTATGKQVILMSDGEKIQANGNYLFHDAVKKHSILKGDGEMIAIHENAVIHASSLTIVQGDEKGVRQFVADGPDGWLEVIDDDKSSASRAEGDKTASKRQKSKLKIRWQDKMVMAPMPGADMQLVTISGDVELDHDHIALKSDKLRVWLVPIPANEVATASSPGSMPGSGGARAVDKPLSNAAKRPEGKLEPVKIEAEGRVAARSDDWDVFAQDLIVSILRKRAAAPAAQAKAPAVAQPLVTVGVKGNALQPIAPKRLAIEAEPKGTLSGVAKASPKDAPAPINPLAEAKLRTDLPAEPKTPLEIRATHVALVVEREGAASRPISAWAEGSVLVTQSPKKPTDEPLEVRGETLQFQRKPDGDQLRVSGHANRWATIKTADVSVFGQREIVLDEVKNEVNVRCPGYLIRESTNDLAGKKLDKPQMVRIDWAGGMKFDGKLASFDGGVRARQATAEINCEVMDVAFDQRIDFKEAREKRGAKERPKTQIDRVDCDKEVVAVEIDKLGDTISRHSVVRGKALLYDNQFGNAKVTGPGDVAIVERSNPRRDANGKLVPPEYPFERTQIVFDTQMTANKEHQTAKFYENVRILRAPVHGMDVELDANRLPRDGLAIDANSFVAMAINEVKDARGNAVKHRDLQAQGDVRVQGQDYYGSCDLLSYEEEKDMLIFNGQQGRSARFFRQLRPGEPAQETSARRVLFWRKSGKTSVEGINGFQYLDVGRENANQPTRR